MAALAGVGRDGTALLTGPRGREVCALVAQLADPTVELPLGATEHATTRRLLDHLRGLDVEPVASLVDPLALVDVLGQSVDSARYWQEPDEREALLRDPRVVAALEPVAHALAVAPASRWWWSPLDPGTQAVVRWLERGRTRADRPQLTGVEVRLDRWRTATIEDEERAAAERPAAFDARWSGSWWATPVHDDVTTTSRRLGRLPAVQLELVEDSMGWERARLAPVEVHRDRRVFEIVAASDWTELVDAYPLDVDRSRRHDWWRATGGTGPWQIPDWPAVGRDHDAVHLTVVGYLGGAGRALTTRGGQTVLAGFDPDLTYWLTDSLTQVVAATTWRRLELDDDAHEWRLEADLP